jgi:hypothetical protein
MLRIPALFFDSVRPPQLTRMTHAGFKPEAGGAFAFLSQAGTRL